MKGEKRTVTWVVTLQKACEKQEEQVWIGSGIKPQGN